MKHIYSASKNSQGFTLVEIMLATGLLLMFSTVTVGLFRIGTLSSSKSENAVKGMMLAKEGVEAVYSIRDTGGSPWNWTSTPASTVNTEYYQPTIVATAWSLGAKQTATPVPTMAAPHTGFSRRVYIQDVRRAVGCGSSICGIVESGGSVDSGTKKIIVIVEWFEERETKQASASSYLTRWK